MAACWQGSLAHCPTHCCIFLRQAGTFCTRAPPVCNTLAKRSEFHAATWAVYRLPGLLVSWQMDLLWYLHSPRTTSHKQSRTTDSHQLLVVPVTFPSALVCPLPLCSTVIPSELVKCFSMDFKMVFEMLDLYIRGHSSVSSASFRLAEGVHCLHPYN